MKVKKSLDSDCLALEGGQPIVDYTYSTWPAYSHDEINAVQEVLRSGKVNYWTGNIGQQFQQAFANFCGLNYAVAVSNGTVALELALGALGIGPGDEVIVTSRTFIASVSSICLCGAKPVFADVNRNSQNITADSIQACITSRTRAVMLVHLAGWPCDMEPILKLASDKNLKVIEDCAQSHGARYKNKLVGSFGDVAAFSFCQDKIISTGGEGGMLVTNDESIWQYAWMYKDHGKSIECAEGNKQTSNGLYRWVHDSFGTNFRMTEMQAAIGLIQLQKLDEWVIKRQEHANMLNLCFSKIPALRITEPERHVEHAYYKYYAFIKPEMLKSEWNRDKIIQAINAEGVPCFAGSCSEVYKEKAFVNAGLAPPESLVVAKELGETSLMFNVHPTIKNHEIQDVCAAVEKVFEYASA